MISHLRNPLDHGNKNLQSGIRYRKSAARGARASKISLLLLLNILNLD